MVLGWDACTTYVTAFSFFSFFSFFNQLLQAIVNSMQSKAGWVLLRSVPPWSAAKWPSRWGGIQHQ
jgi:hypothetical protein